MTQKGRAHKNRPVRFYLMVTSISILTVLLVLFVHNHMSVYALVQNQTDANVAITEVISRSVWPRYRDMLGQHPTNPERHEALISGIANLDAEIRDLIHGTKLVKLKIYNLDGLTIYSSDPSQIFEVSDSNPGFLSARQGVIASGITLRNNFDSFDGQISRINVVSSYLPVYDPETKTPEAVFEAYSDVTDLVQAIDSLEIRIAGGLTLAAILIFGGLGLYSRRKDQSDKLAAQKRARLNYQASFDSLTSLPNASSLRKKLRRLDASESVDTTIKAILRIGIDRFKLVNEAYGREAANSIILQVTERLLTAAGSDEQLFRVGGDNFVLLQYPSDKQSAVGLAKQIFESFRAPFHIEGNLLFVSLSIGVSTVESYSSKLAARLNHAESAMFRAKQLEGNQYVNYLPGQTDNAQRRLALESSLRAAFDNHEFELAYQPRVAADDNSILGVEALLRWRRRHGEEIGPSRFVPSMEKIGLIDKVGRWALLEACNHCKAWQKSGRKPISVSVNISPLQFKGPDLVRIVRWALSKSELNPKYLELELTESALIDDFTQVVEVIHRLKRIGVSFSIDDFGTGYSSLNYLKRLPINRLKIDGSFIGGIDNNPGDLAIVTAMIGMAQSFDIGVVAEGVERAQQARTVIECGCQELQGFLYHPALPAPQIEKLLDREVSIAAAGRAIEQLSGQAGREI